MPEYRAYIIGNDGHFQDAKPLVCVDDTEAIAEAKQLVNHHDVELWQRGRKVETFKAQPQVRDVEPVMNGHPTATSDEPESDLARKPTATSGGRHRHDYRRDPVPAKRQARIRMQSCFSRRLRSLIDPF
jgi:hypothetical protein